MTNEEKLYELRVNMGLSLEQAAGCIGIHKSTLCRYEQKYPARMRPEVLKKICRLYHVPEQYFREGKKTTTESWFRILSPEEAAAAYAALPERDQLRVSRILTRHEESDGTTEIS